MHPESIISLFWSYVDASGGPDACWEWKRSKHPQGYGQWRPYGVKTKLYRTHRMVWEFANGPIPDGMHICHTCDNPPCCNPAHLFLGTAKDNMQDKAAKGRAPGRDMHGLNNPRAKLTEKDVIAIREAAALGARHLDIANQYGVAKSHITGIVNRRHWSHVP